MVLVQPAGQSEPVEVERSALKRSRGAGVVVPGPLKLVQRCRDKIAVDYEKEPWPPAASLCDIGRCSVVLEDPYAMAVIVEYLKQEFTVLWVKNRFYGDTAVEVTAEQILAEFYAAETQGEETESSSTAVTTQSLTSTHSVRSSKMYRDVKLDL